MKTNFVSTRTLWMGPRTEIGRMEAELATANEEQVSSRYADVGLQLGYRTGTGLDLHQTLKEFAAQKERNGMTTLRLSSSNTALDQVRKDGESFMALVTPGKLTGDSGPTVALEATTKLQAFTAYLNEAAGGQYLFAGINTGTRPVADYTSTPPSSAKSAVDAAFQAAFGFPQGTQPGSAAISGAQMKSFLDGPFATLFADPQWGATWSTASDRNIRSAIGSGKTIETSVNANAAPLRQLAMAYTMGADLGLGALSPDAKDAVFAKMRELLGSATAGVTQLQAGLGRSLANVTDSTNQIDAQNKIVSQNLTDLEVPDATGVGVRIKELQTQIQIAYSITGQLKNLSLINYI